MPPKRVVDSDDEEMPKPKTAPAKKVVAEDSDEEEVATRKPTAKKAAAAKDASSDDEALTTKKPSAKKAAASKKAADSDSEDEPAARKKGPADDSSDDDAPARSGKHADPNDMGSNRASSSSALVDLIDYDSMTFDAFKLHLSRQSKQQRLEEKKAVSERQAADVSTSESADRHFDGAAAYSYKFMLDRILEICRKNNPELSQSERIKLPMPKIDRMGSKKTVLVNFKDICNALNRSEEDVKDFIEKTLTTQGSIDANHCLILRYQNAKVQTFEKLMVKYVEEFVKCSACGRIQTELEKESSSRLLVMKCKDCQASRYIQVAGSATYKAQTGKRRDRAVMA